MYPKTVCSFLLMGVWRQALDMFGIQWFLKFLLDHKNIKMCFFYHSPAFINHHDTGFFNPIPPGGGGGGLLMPAPTLNSSQFQAI